MKVIVAIDGEAGSAVFNDEDGVLFLRIIGKAHEGYLGRGESQEVIKKMITLAASDNTGHIMFAPKLVAFAIRVISEQLTVKCLTMNSVNDRVVMMRHEKDGFQKTNELLASSKAHREVLTLTRLLHILTEAFLSYSAVYFYRQEELKTSSVTSLDDYRNRQQPIVAQNICQNTALAQLPVISEMEDTLSLVLKLISRALEFDDGRTFIVAELLEEKERQEFNTQADKSRIGRIFADIVEGVGGVDYAWPNAKKLVRSSESCSPRRYVTIKVEES